MSTKCPSADVVLAHSGSATDPKEGKSCDLCRDRFWNHGCRHGFMDETRDTRNTPRPGDWKLLAERASKEKDPEKLMSLVSELSRVLEEQQRKGFTSD
jgi:hypothetical protein